MFVLLAAACTTEPDTAGDSVGSDDAGVHGTLSITHADGAVYKTSLALDDGTTLAVRATWDPDVPPRYTGERPTFMLARGSLGAGNFLDANGTKSWMQISSVVVEVVLPGGYSEDQASTGTFDYRGTVSQRAFAEAIRWAGGMRVDVDGNSIQDIIPDASRNLGLVGTSAGVNLGFGALAQDPLGLAFVQWVVAWEGPYTDQYLDVELMSYEFETNPTYEPGSCSDTSCPFTTEPERIMFDPDAASFTEEPLGAGRIDLEGVLYVDEDGDGHYTPGDFYYHMLAAPGPDGELACHPSVELSEVLDAQSERLFGEAGRPSWLPPTEWLRAYWLERDSSVVLPTLAAARPDLRIIVAGSEEDHIYRSIPDHPHVLGLNHYLQALGFEFVRLNPDSSYLTATIGLDPGSLPDNDAGTSPDWTEALEWLEPEGGRVPFDHFVPIAAVLELADRVHQDAWIANVPEPLLPVKPLI